MTEIVIKHENKNIKDFGRMSRRCGERAGGQDYFHVFLHYKMAMQSLWLCLKYLLGIVIPGDQPCS